MSETITGNNGRILEVNIVRMIPDPPFLYQIGKIIYLTNAIENPELRNIIRNRVHFPTDQSATKPESLPVSGHSLFSATERVISIHTMPEKPACNT
jgi:transposase-like protein